MILRISIMIVLILSALMFYSIGSMAGMGVFLLFGVLFEGAFWFGLFRGFKTNRVESGK